MLSNLETEREKLIQIILIGQPELRKKLEHPRLEQFRQRVVFHYHIEPLSQKEAVEYIKHRLKKAGNANMDIFAPDAIDEIYKFSRGVPRLINLACHSALITGLIKESRRITKDIAKEAMGELLQHTQYPTRNTQYQNEEETQWDELLRH